MDDIKIPWKGWQIVGRIGRGAYGNVYEIKRIRYGLEERCAMKVMHIPQNAADIDIMRIQGLDDDEIVQTCNGYVANVVKEYKLMLGLTNVPNIVKVYDYEVVRDDEELLWTLYIRMELLTPITQNRDCVNTEAQILTLGKDVCAALVACHQHNILHRDVKIQNILVDREGNFRLGDFGVSRVIENTTQATAGVGSIDYMAPEIALRLGSYGQQADIYSLGMVLYSLLNMGRFPFQPLPPEKFTASFAEECRRRKWRGEPFNKPVNGSLDFQKVVLKACEADTKNRYFSAQNMLDDLNRIVLSGTQDSSAVHGDNILPPPMDIPEELTEIDIGRGKDNAVDDKKENINDDDGTLVNGIPSDKEKDGGYHIKFNPPQRNTQKPKEPQKDSPKDEKKPEKENPKDGTGTNNGKNRNKNGGNEKPSIWRYALNAGLVCLSIILAISIVNVVRGWFGTSKSPDTDPGYVIDEPARDLDIPLKTLEGEWEAGSFQVNVYDDYYAEIILNEELFNNHEGRADGVQGVTIRLYHDTDKNNYYNVGFIYQAGKLAGSASYFVDGTNDSDYEPSSFTFEEKNGSVSANLIATNKLTETLTEIEDIQVIYLKPNTSTGPVTVYTTFEAPAEEETPAAVTQTEFEPFVYDQSEGMIYYEEFDVWDKNNQEVIEAQRLLVDQWSDGGIRVKILDENRITVDLESDFFTDPESKDLKKSLILQIYHDLNKNHCYNISFGYNESGLFASAVYLENGVIEYSYTPEIFDWTVDNGIVRFNLQANGDVPRNMFGFEGIHVIYHIPNESPEVALSYYVSDNCSSIQFIHIEGPDDKYGGDETEKAVIRGFNLSGETLWTHETDVKFEIYQSYRVEAIGYINDKYFYSDDDTLVILDAATGKELKRVKNVGASITDVLMDFDGTMYLCCYWGPHFVEISPEYKVVHKIDSFGGMCDWAIDVYKENDLLYVVCDLGPMQREEDYIFEINPDDYSFVLTNPATPIN